MGKGESDEPVDEDPYQLAFIGYINLEYNLVRDHNDSAAVPQLVADEYLR